MLQSSYGVKTVHCASGPDSVCLSSTVRRILMGLFMNHRLLLGSGTDVFQPPNSGANQEHSAAHSELQRAAE
jgi:hypothetical protein